MIAVGRSVDGINHHGQRTTAGHARLFTHHSKARAVQNAKRDLVGGYIEAILRGTNARKSAVLAQLDNLANLVRALTKWVQK
jgi:hypothetical protein